LFLLRFDLRQLPLRLFQLIRFINVGIAF
jgi:hypothetical protein